MSTGNRIVLIVMIVLLAGGYVYLVADGQHWLPWSQPAEWQPALEEAEQVFLANAPARPLATTEFGKTRALLQGDARYLRFLQERCQSEMPNEAATALVLLLLVYDLGMDQFPAGWLEEQVPGIKRPTLATQAKALAPLAEQHLPAWLKLLAAGPLPAVIVPEPDEDKDASTAATGGSLGGDHDLPLPPSWGKSPTADELVGKSAGGQPPAKRPVEQAEKDDLSFPPLPPLPKH